MIYVVALLTLLERTAEITCIQLSSVSQLTALHTVQQPLQVMLKYNVYVK
jgi:hypothetical protein